MDSVLARHSNVFSFHILNPRPFIKCCGRRRWFSLPSKHRLCFTWQVRKRIFQLMGRFPGPHLSIKTLRFGANSLGRETQTTSKPKILILTIKPSCSVWLSGSVPSPPAWHKTTLIKTPKQTFVSEHILLSLSRPDPWFPVPVSMPPPSPRLSLPHQRSLRHGPGRISRQSRAVQTQLYDRKSPQPWERNFPSELTH